MNRKKKINQIYKSRMKKQNAKLHSSNKPRYISKADREKMEAEQAAEAAANVNTTVDATVETVELETTSTTEA